MAANEKVFMKKGEFGKRPTVNFQLLNNAYKFNNFRQPPFS
jgi:hypothetical protein